MKYFLPVILCFLLISSYNKSFAQQKDTLKSPPTAYYQQQLGIDQAKAIQVGKIYDTYKGGVSQVMADKTQSEDQKRKKIDLLITQKNAALKVILTVQQQQKIIPSSEH